MKVEGTCSGQVILQSDLENTFQYLSDHEKIIMFNPLCKRVTPTGLDNVYQWDFEVADPKGHPMRLIFFVEQNEQPVLALPEHHRNTPSHELPAHVINEHKVGNQIIWSEYPVKINGKMPDEHTFIGQAHGSMDLKKVDEHRTRVGVNIKVHIDFQVPALFRIFPEPIFKVMAETAMSVSMQNVSKKMLENISRDFHCSLLGETNFGAARSR
ncbi:conserved hypothetical protein [Chloroherpeton thalassium ATCC 35110]|uniref:Cyclase/dehydrase n=1 Tax=Chloroherpeton thalassium (strain ATCC 35110 / GB-78) TaxID=517418 RepID=B3QTG6_CHLT3|nr:DUF1997 domain-containing protein [Chloroherpeton thalassium]ACF12712.1 conserved hypothetical protein [Chloroherpeton thalassium ATCC 35110]